MTAKEFLVEQARRFKFTATERLAAVWLRVDTNYSLENRASASDLMQLAALLTEAEYSLTFQKDNSVHVFAPHRYKHAGHGPIDSSGWECTHGLTVKGCEVFNGPTTPAQKLLAGLRGRQLTREDGKQKL